jgi:hypothetical protein
MVDEDDLSYVLENVASDARPATRIRIVNSPETRAFLEIGLMVLRDDLLDHRGPDPMEDRDPGTRLFGGLSQARLLERAEREDAHSERPRMLTVGMFRDRWRYKSQYTEDLIAYVLRPSSRDQLTGEMLDRIKETGTVPLPELVRQLADGAMGRTLNDPLWRVQMILRVALPNHPRVLAFSRYRYEDGTAHWAAILEEITGRYRLELQSGYTWKDVADLLHAVTDGARFRARATGHVAELSSGETVLAGAILAMLRGLLVSPPTQSPALPPS